VIEAHHLERPRTFGRRVTFFVFFTLPLEGQTSRRVVTRVTIMRTTLLVAALVGLVATGDVAFDVADFIKAGDGASAALHRGSL
jgi:hypothetical protein